MPWVLEEEAGYGPAATGAGAKPITDGKVVRNKRTTGSSGGSGSLGDTIGTSNDGGPLSAGAYARGVSGDGSSGGAVGWGEGQHVGAAMPADGQAVPGDAQYSVAAAAGGGYGWGGVQQIHGPSPRIAP